ncbi:MAG: DJ-1/PfpI family protein [Alphaproteobacteria bacterium]
MPVRLAVLLIDRFADWEHGWLTAPVRDFFRGQVTFHTPGGRTVASEGGMRALADGAIETLTPDDFDGLAVIGSSQWFGEDAPDIAALVRAADGAGRTLGFICGATLAAARAGLLDSRAHTSNEAATLAKAAAYRGADRYRDVRHAVRDGNLVTAGGFAARSFAYEMTAALYPDEAVNVGYLKAELTAESFS